jgi:hypothetical protein
VGFIKYAVEMGLVVMKYILSFIKIGSGIQMFIGGIHGHTDIKTRDCISLLRESRLKTII